MILSASEKAVKDNPERIKLIVDMHRQAIDYAMANPAQIVDMAMQKLGPQKKSVELADWVVEGLPEGCGGVGRSLPARVPGGRSAMGGARAAVFALRRATVTRIGLGVVGS